MNEGEALATLQALSQETRLRIMRLLIEAGPEGLAAGRISCAVGATPSNASFHLGHLGRAGLVRTRREGRSIVYAAAFAAVAGLIDYLMKDCCGGRSALCEFLYVESYSGSLPSRDAVAAAESETAVRDGRC